MSIYKEVKATPLKKKHIAHKQWTITDETAGTFGIVSYSGQASNGEFSISDVSSSNIALEPLTSNNYYQRTIHSNIYHLYYSDTENAYISNENEYLGQQIRTAHQGFEVISIPSKIFGDRIKESSFTMSNAAAELYDDGAGNIIDTHVTNLSNFKRLNRSDYIIKVDFNEGWKFFKDNPVTTKAMRTGDEHLSDFSDGPFEPHAKNITFGIHDNNGPQNGSYGAKNTTFVNFHGSQSLNSGSNSFVKIDKSITLGTNDRQWNKDFSVSFWIKAPLSQSVTCSYSGPFDNLTNPEIGQYQYRAKKDHDVNVIATSRQWSSQVPWELQIYNSSSSKKGKIRFLRGKTENFTEITSSAVLNDNTWHHIVMQVATGSMELYVDKELQAAKTDPVADELVYDKSIDIHIGARPWGYKSRQYYGEVRERVRGSNGFSGFRTRNVFNNKGRNYIYPFSGSMDKFKINNRALVDSEINSLYDYYRDTDIVGNLFYNHGIAVITDQSGSYTDLVNDYTLYFKATTEHSIHNYQCIVEDEQFNITYNPSARVNYDINNPKLKGFATASDFTPYITTIGLYNNFNELLAIGKLANPVKSPTDIDIVFNVQFDT